MELPQARHFVAPAAFASMQNGQFLTSAATSSLTNILDSRQTTKAMTTKAMIALRNAP